MKTVFLVLLLVPLGRTEREYFLQSNASSWELARKHCQVCYRELATITAENTRHLLEKLDNSSRAVWVGLRRRLNETVVSLSNSSNSTGPESHWFSGTAPWFQMSSDSNNTNNTKDTWFSFFEGKLPWSRWSNGDPVTFQNWYPGRPIPKPKPEPIKCDAQTRTSINDATPNSPTVTVTVIPSTTGMKTQTTDGTTNQRKESDTCPKLTSLLQCIDDQGVKDVLSRYVTNPTYTTSNPPNNGSTISTDGTPPPTISRGVQTTPFDINTTATTPSYPNNPNPTSVTSDMRPTSPGIMPTSTSDPSTMSTSAAPLSKSPTPTVPPCPNVTDSRELDLNTFIEDACLVLLSFGVWWERACSEVLPYVCYDDRFYGEVKVSNITNISASVVWLEGPGEISGYRVEVKSKLYNWTETTTSNLTTEFKNLTAGIKYTVYVFPIKCGRDLNPQTTYFYSKPNFIQDLKILDAKESSISLSWSPPQGGVDFYRLCIKENCINTTSSNYTIQNLTSGTNHTVAISAEVADMSTPGPQMYQYFFTKPKSVKKLNWKNADNNSLTVFWEQPDENFKYTYSVLIQDSLTGTIVFNEIILNTEKLVPELSSGTEFNITVRTSIEVELQSLRGDPKSIMAFTVPNPVSYLTLKSTAENINAEWNGPEGRYENFTVTLYDPVNTAVQSTPVSKGVFSYNFADVKAGANYTVVVYVLGVGNQKSTNVTESKYTLPKKPRDLKATVHNKSSISLNWQVPEKCEGVKIDYDVHYKAKFWKESNKIRVSSTSVTLHDLRPGTTYDFNVNVFAGNLNSENVTAEGMTFPNLRNITLTILCSSSQFEGCQTATTVTALLEKLKAHFQASLDGIFLNRNEKII